MTTHEPPRLPHAHRLPPPLPVLHVRARTNTQENAGFKLLMKLGYKGGGLGKDGAGATKPLMPEVKHGRAG